MGLDPVSMAVGGAALGLLGGMTQSPKAPQVAAPPPPPQLAHAPDVNTVAAAQAGTGQAGGSPGVAQTLLTGPAGVDPNTLNLGKSTLLGG